MSDSSATTSTPSAGSGTSVARNRLAHETSPYLLQHQSNPVDWYPWGPEALERSRAEDKPIFLSIGYSACHWCHVMEHESFEDAEIAALMNRWFINIKVDREERPDLDQIYMNAVMAISGSGGWPMSVFLTPTGEPFFGGTYWPPTSRWGRPGFREILQAVHEAWIERRPAVETQARELTERVVDAGQPQVDRVPLSIETLRRAERSLIRSADRERGGFGTAPKFPHPMDLRVLLRCFDRERNPEAWDVVAVTLDQMSRGGIYDHLGGGFARYSTDANWLVPHFEKMLYDNAQLATVYLEAYQLTGDGRWARVVRETLDYVLREMTAPMGSASAGAFFSTQDADSEGVEGKFFVWTVSEVQAVLGEAESRLFCAAYDVTPHGNWEHRSILHRERPLSAIAAEWQLSIADCEERLASARARLFAARSQRIAPGRDEKVLVSWNGLMMAAMAQAGRVLSEPRYTSAAIAAATFIQRQMTQDGSRLWHTAKDGVARLTAYLDDYAALIEGLVELHQTTLDERWLTLASGYAERLLSDFADDAGGGFFFTARDHERLIARQKDIQDNATPSGNSLAAMALLRLGLLTERSAFRAAGRATLEMLSGLMNRVAMAAGQALVAFDFEFGPVTEWLLCDGDDPTAVDALLAERPVLFQPRTLMRRLRHSGTSGGADATPVGRGAFAGKTAIDGQPTLYVCQGSTCQPPIVGRDAIRKTWATLAASAAEFRSVLATDHC